MFPKLNQTVSAAWIDALSIDDDDTGKDESSKASTEATGSGEDNAFGGISAKAKGDKPECDDLTPERRSQLLTQTGPRSLYPNSANLVQASMFRLVFLHSSRHTPT